MLGVKWTGGNRTGGPRGMIRARHERVGGQTNTVRAVAGCDVVFGCMDSIDGRHVIVNDNKSSTYKLGLLRTLVHLAETASGLVIERADDYVDIPFGAVGLYWLKQYLPLVLHHRLRQHREDAGALHHLSGFRRSAVVRVGVFPGKVPADCRSEGGRLAPQSITSISSFGHDHQFPSVDAYGMVLEKLP